MESFQSKTPSYPYSQLKNYLESYTYATRQATEGQFSLPKANINFQWNMEFLTAATDYIKAEINV